MITLIGTGHAFHTREKIKDWIIHKRPPAVCFELDERRYEILERNGFSFFPPIYTLKQGITADSSYDFPPDGIIGAIEGSREIGAQAFCIDRNVDETIKRLIEASISEFFNPMEMIRKLFFTLSIPLEIPVSIEKFFSLSFKDFIERAIKKFEVEPEKYRSLFGNFYPFYKRVILDEREEHMTQEIKKIRKDAGLDPLVVIVSIGHLEPLKNLLQPEEVEIAEIT